MFSQSIAKIKCLKIIVFRLSFRRLNPKIKPDQGFWSERLNSWKQNRGKFVKGFNETQSAGKDITKLISAIIYYENQPL